MFALIGLLGIVGLLVGLLGVCDFGCLLLLGLLLVLLTCVYVCFGCLLFWVVYGCARLLLFRVVYCCVLFCVTF